MKYFLADNGTLTHWTTDDGHEILFPQQTIVVNGEEKLRGGAPVCSPVFGPQPETDDYKDADLPQHGLVRLGAEDERCVYMVRLGDSTIGAYHSKPWCHRTTIDVNYDEKVEILSHVLTVVCEKRKGQTPFSIAFHPYIATYGKSFTIRHGPNLIESKDIEHDISFFIDRPDGPLEIALDHGTVYIDVRDGDYDQFCIWTDRIEEYICVEPVLGKRNGIYHMLSYGEKRIGICKMMYFPR